MSPYFPPATSSAPTLPAAIGFTHVASGNGTGNGGSGTTSTVTIPATAAVGDVAVVACFAESMVGTATAPAGWIQVGQTRYMCAFAKVLAAGDINVGFNLTFASSPNSGSVYSVWRPSTPIAAGSKPFSPGAGTGVQINPSPNIPTPLLHSNFTDGLDVVIVAQNSGSNASVPVFTATGNMTVAHQYAVQRDGAAILTAPVTATGTQAAQTVTTSQIAGDKYSSRVMLHTPLV